MGIPEREERKMGGESLFKETVDENLPSPGKEWNIQFHKASSTPEYLNERKNLL